MAIRSYKYTVGTSPTLMGVFDSDLNNGLTVWLYADSGGHNVWLGDSGVSASTGYILQKGVAVGPLGIGKDEQLYAVSDQVAGVDVRILAIGA